jgi:suppressor of G2 allele of SKP1
MSFVFEKGKNQEAPRVHDDAIECSVQYLVDNNYYAEALQLIAIGKFDSTPDMLVCTARCHYFQGKISAALEVLNHAAKLGWNIPDVLLLKGRCLYRMYEYERALAVFTEADQMISNAYTQTWILRCNAHLEMEANPENPDKVLVYDAQNALGVKYDWYQSDTHISLLIFVPNLSRDSLKVDFGEKKVDVEITQNGISDYHFNLEKEIIPSGSRVELSGAKVEIKMKKAEKGTQGWKLYEASTV